MRAVYSAWACLFVCVWMCSVYVCVCMCMCMCMYVCVCICMYMIRICICMCMYMNVCVCIGMYMNVCICVYVWACMQFLNCQPEKNGLDSGACWTGISRSRWASIPGFATPPLRTSSVEPRESWPQLYHHELGLHICHTTDTVYMTCVLLLS